MQKHNFIFIKVILTLNQNFTVYPTCNTRLKRRITVNEPLNHVSFHQHLSLRKNSSCLELFWSVFSCSQTEYGEILRISPYLVQMPENTDQDNSEYGHFSRSVSRIPTKYRENISHCFYHLRSL